MLTNHTVKTDVKSSLSTAIMISGFLDTNNVSDGEAVAGLSVALIAAVRPEVCSHLDLIGPFMVAINDFMVDWKGEPHVLDAN